MAARADPDEPDVGQIHRLYVAPETWGLGIGTRLHDEALTLLADRGFTTAGLWVLERNDRARRMYERRGWHRAVGATKEWPELGVFEVRYEKHLR